MTTGPITQALAEHDVDCILLDVDGTLVDSNYQHVVAWCRALRRNGLTVPGWLVHQHIGMGGDQIVPALAGDEFDAAHGDDARDAWRKEFDPMIEDVVALEGASELLQELKTTGRKIVLASSGAADHVEHYVDLLGARDVADAWTTADDVETTKPEPDLLEVARDKVGGHRPLVIGDSPWDFRAAARLGVPGLGVRTGGFTEIELRDAGAAEVFDSLPALARALVAALEH